MPAAQIPCVEMTCLQGLADLERLEGPWLDCMGAGEPESVATVMRLMRTRQTLELEIREYLHARIHTITLIQ